MVLLDILVIVICCLDGCANQRPGGGGDAVGVQNGTRTLFDNGGRFLVEKKMTVK